MIERENIQWLFFDVGSTLVDESKVYNSLINKMIEGSKVDFHEFYATMIDNYRQGKKGDLEAAKLWGFQVPNWSSEEEVLYPETHSTLQLLSQKHKIGIIANQPFGTKDRLRNFGILDFITVLISSAEVGVSKPNPKIFDLALSEAGCMPQNAVMNGDRLDNDIVPAKKLGMNTIWIKQGFSSYNTNRNLLEYADVTINRLDEISMLIGVS